MSEKQNTISEATEHQLWDKWLGYLRKADGRFLYQNRTEHLIMFSEIFFQNGISFDDAKSYRDRCVRALTTEDGYKARKKHKGGNWRKNTTEDFNTILADTYIANPSSTPIRTTVSAPDPLRIPQNEDILEWAKSKYDSNPLVIAEAHRIASVFYFEFLEDTFY